MRQQRYGSQVGERRILRCGTFDLLPISRTSLKLVKSVNHQENDGHEEEQIH